MWGNSVLRISQVEGNLSMLCEYSLRSGTQKNVQSTLDIPLVKEGVVDRYPLDELYVSLTKNVDKTLTGIFGDFTLAFTDELEEALIVANDVYATRPVYYYVDPANTFFCASNDLRSLLVNEVIPFQVNFDLCLLYPTSAFSISENEMYDQSFFKGIFRLPPGSYLVWNINSFKISRYWNIFDCLHGRFDQKNYVQEFRQLMIDAVSSRLASGKTMIEVSGGLDSGNVLGAALAGGFKDSLFAINISFASDDMVYTHDKELVRRLFMDLGIPAAIVIGDQLIRIPNVEPGRDPLWFLEL